MGFVKKTAPFAVLHISLDRLYVLFALRHLPG
jgi:hypothetical protein